MTNEAKESKALKSAMWLLRMYHRKQWDLKRDTKLLWRRAVKLKLEEAQRELESITA